MYDVVYMGYSDKMIEYLIDSHDFNLNKVVGVKGRMSEHQYDLINMNCLDYKELKSSDELKELATYISGDEIVIMYRFEYIIPQYLIDNIRIFNIHDGNLRTNRGAHPIVWSILNGEQNTYLSLYQLTGGIDVGILIDEYNTIISEDETSVTLNKKLPQGIPRLLVSLKEYLDGKISGELITDGKYNLKITPDNYTIDLQNDSAQCICAKIRSQDAYQGAILEADGVQYRIKSYEYKNCKNMKRERYIKEDKLFIYEDGKELKCFLIPNSVKKN
jgi:methionyl-tRNA formyltransferase